MSSTSRIAVACLTLALLVSKVCGEESEATKLLKARTAEFEQEVIEVTEGVYTAVFSNPPHCCRVRLPVIANHR